MVLSSTFIRLMWDFWISLKSGRNLWAISKDDPCQHVLMSCTAAYCTKQRNNIFSLTWRASYLIGKVRLTWSGSSLLFRFSADALLFQGASSLSLQPETPDAVCRMKSASLPTQVYKPKRKSECDNIIRIYWTEEFVHLFKQELCGRDELYFINRIHTKFCMSCGKRCGSDLSTSLESGAEVAELVKRWMGDVGAWCLPGYGVPLALILWKEEKNKCFVLSGDIFPLKDREEGWTSLQESVKRCEVNSNVILLDSWYSDLTVLSKRTVHLSTSY